MVPELSFEADLFDETVVRESRPGRWTLLISHATDRVLETWTFPCAGSFDPDVLNVVGRHLNQRGIAYRGSGSWNQLDDTWSSMLYPIRQLGSAFS